MTTPEHALFAAFKPLLPTIAGVVLSLKFLPKETTFFNRLTSVLAGITISYYIGTALVEYYNFTGVYKAAAEFSVGVFGLGIFSHLYNEIPKTLAAIRVKYTGASGEE